MNHKVIYKNILMQHLNDCCIQLHVWKKVFINSIFEVYNPGYNVGYYKLLLKTIRLPRVD